MPYAYRRNLEGTFFDSTPDERACSCARPLPEDAIFVPYRTRLRIRSTSTSASDDKKEVPLGRYTYLYVKTSGE